MVNTNETIVVQWNPRSGTGGRRSEIIALVRRLRQHGFRVRLFHHRERMDQYVACLPVSRKLNCIIGCGGDGTIADLLNRHPHARIGMLPVGTENLLARYFRMPRTGEAVADLVRDGYVSNIDTCFAGSHRFLLMLSIGVDADVVRLIHRNRTGNIHRLSYLWPTLLAFLGFRKDRRATVRINNDTTATGTHVIVTNIPAYGFGFPFAPDAKPNDGLLDVRVFDGRSLWHTVLHAIRVWFGLSSAEREVKRFSVSELTILDASVTPADGAHQQTPVAIHSTMAVQADGDPAPELPLSIRVIPRSLELIVPKSPNVVFRSTKES